MFATFSRQLKPGCTRVSAVFRLPVRVFREWQALQRFRKLPSEFKDIVFYSEGAGDWPHIGPVVEALLNRHQQKISYLTSDPDDPGLALRHECFRPFQIGSGAVRTILFRGIECGHFVMTLTDLDTFHLKRSVHPVHYVYMFHAINSTHTVYRSGAFDAYDTILCVGPHHVDEIRKTEQVYGLKKKELIEHGSIKLDRVILEYEKAAEAGTSVKKREVLVAPSWGECSLIENPVGGELIETLLTAGYRTVLRLHPMTVRRFPSLIPSLRRKYQSQPLFVVEDDMNALESWLRSDAMISDWSGAAIEYAFATLKPVIYINTPQKINNPNWRDIGAESFEDMIRHEIGQVVEPDVVASVPDLIGSACRDTANRRDQVLSARGKWVFNVRRSSEVAADYLASISRGV